MVYDEVGVDFLCGLGCFETALAALAALGFGVWVCGLEFGVGVMRLALGFIVDRGGFERFFVCCFMFFV